MSEENARTVAVYEEFGEKYLARNAAELESNPRARADDEWQAALLAKYTDGLAREAKIFEVGSASGRDAKTLAKLEFKNVTVSDVADFFVEHLRKEGFAPLKFNLITDEFPEEYDAIICWAVLVHFRKDEAVVAMRKIHAALKPGGRFILSVKYKAGHEEEWGDYHNYIGAKRYFAFWGREELLETLTEIGFKELSVEQRGGARACWLNCCVEKV